MAGATLRSSGVICLLHGVASLGGRESKRVAVGPDSSGKFGTARLFLRLFSLWESLWLEELRSGNGCVGGWVGVVGGQLFLLNGSNVVLVRTLSGFG